MAFSPLYQPIYAKGPLAEPPSTLPATAKTAMTDATNTVTVASNAAASGNKKVFSRIFVHPNANLSAGRLMLFINTGSAIAMVKDVAHAAITVSTTAEGTEIDFGYTDSDPLILEEGWSALVGSAVAQAAGAAIIVARGKLF